MTITHLAFNSHNPPLYQRERESQSSSKVALSNGKVNVSGPFAWTPTRPIIAHHIFLRGKRREGVSSRCGGEENVLLCHPLWE
jgi:hypothetical protein